MIIQKCVQGFVLKRKIIQKWKIASFYMRLPVWCQRNYSMDVHEICSCGFIWMHDFLGKIYTLFAHLNKVGIKQWRERMGKIILSTQCTVHVHAYMPFGNQLEYGSRQGHHQKRRIRIIKLTKKNSKKKSFKLLWDVFLLFFTGIFNSRWNHLVLLNSFVYGLRMHWYLTLCVRHLKSPIVSLCTEIYRRCRMSTIFNGKIHGKHTPTGSEKEQWFLYK